MNTLQSLMRQIEQLGAVRSRGQSSPRAQTDRWVKTTQLHQHLLSYLPLKFTPVAVASTGSYSANRPRLKHRTRSPVLLLIAVISLTGTMGHRFYNQPKLDVGTKAPQTITAPASANVPDYKTTEEQRKAARTGAVPVLAIDLSVDRYIYQELQKFVEEGSQLREMAGSLPFVRLDALTASIQLYLRQCPEWEWRMILAQTEDRSIAVSPNLGRSSEAQEKTSKLQQQAITELRTYQQTASPEAFKTLIEGLSQARQRYLNALNRLSEESSELSQLYDTSLFELSDKDWQEMQTGIYRVSRRMLAQGIPEGLPRDILREAVKLHVKDEMPAETQPLAVKVLASVLQSNLVKDQEGTKQLAELAAQKVKPVMVAIQQGDVIVSEGEEITQPDFVLLDHFGLSRRGVNWLGLTGFVCLTTAAIGVVLFVEKHCRLRRRDHLLLLLLTLSSPLLMTLGVPWSNLSAIGILSGGFYGSAVGVTVVGLLSVVLPIGMEVIDKIHLLASAVGGLLGAFAAARLRSREELALLGLTVGLTQGIVYLLVTLIVSSSAGLIWYSLVTAAALQSLGGLAWSVIALGISPYLEHLFDLITPTRLAELANPNRPLLKRLAAEAPGTFQHTLFVASLAEAAARELGCNVELVRTGTLYHDIGKMHDPLGFCENQMSGPNKHDEINNPWKSADLIKKHVTEGLVMARKYRLPKAIQAFIPEHQGTMLIAYFYHQAQQMAAKEGAGLGSGRPPRIVCELREADFRYDGPIPQSRETGIVMLADSCEAALRSLKDATHEEALNMVNKILRARWQDDQLVDSGLTREEMSQIGEIFVRVWEQFNHKRVAYPKAVLASR